MIYLGFLVFGLVIGFYCSWRLRLAVVPCSLNMTRAPVPLPAPIPRLPVQLYMRYKWTRSSQRPCPQLEVVLTTALTPRRSKSPNMIPQRPLFASSTRNSSIHAAPRFSADVTSAAVTGALLSL